MAQSMVVPARKTSVSAPPPASRSNSSQPLPRAVKGKAPLVTVNGAPLATPGTTPGNTKTKKLLAKKKSKHKTSPSSFTKCLFLLLLSAFTLYATSICRSSSPSRDSSPICSTLNVYRTQILQPYVIPRLQSIYTRVSPHLAPLKPYATSTLAFTDAHIIPRVSATLTTAKIVYETHVHPRLWFFIDQYWNGIIKPIYFKGPHPFLEVQTRPYRSYYHSTVVPYARKARIQLRDAYARTRPLADPYIEAVRYSVSHAYELARYRGLDAWAHVRPRLVRVLEGARVRAGALAGSVADARREYVDPHLGRIWEKIGECTGSEGGRYNSSDVPGPSSAAKETATAEESPRNADWKEKGEAPVPTRTREPTSHNGGTQEASVLDTDADAFAAILESAHVISRRLASESESSLSSAFASSPSTSTP
ncbi:hypothetical protein DXG03_005246 [Asterophora parasitica]|uniref:Uncharacterized protein n=1 Tax=Asterophora parasitica TaxID=117018 RepID=A0A9P7K9Z6_9AGAR|nr:hypothetical protein DXG03_005246 [Asterophora parasitica]